MLIALGAITAFFILAAGVVMPLFTRPHVQRRLERLTVGLSRVLFPVVLLLGLNGLLVGILQSYDHFTIPAISPAVWNVVIIVLLVVLRPHFHGGENTGVYALRDRDPRGDRRAAGDGLRRARADRLPAERSHRLARPAHQAGVHADAARDDRPRDRQPRPADQLGRSARSSTRKRRARSTTPSASTCSRRGCSASPSRPSCSRRSAAWPRGRDARAMRRAVGIGMRQINLLLIPAAAFMIVLADADRAAALRTRRVRPPDRPTWSRSRCSGSRSACRSAASTCC